MSSNHPRTKGLSSPFVNSRAKANLRRISVQSLVTIVVLSTAVLASAVSAGYFGTRYVSRLRDRAATSSLKKDTPVLPRTTKLIHQPAFLMPASQMLTAEVLTDKHDYAPGDTAQIVGSGFEPGESVTLQVVHIEGGAEGGEGHEPWSVTADERGSFATTWFVHPDDSLGSTFLLTAVGDTSGIAAQLIFTDAGNASADLDQCRNGKSTMPNNCNDANTPNGLGWVNGNAGSSNSHYIEGYSIPYRLRMDNLPLNTSVTVVLGYDVLHSGGHAIDYLTHYQRLESHLGFGHPAETINPIFGQTGLSATVSDFDIPTPSSLGSPVAGQPGISFLALPDAERKMTLFGGTITNVQYVGPHPNLNAANASQQIAITFTTDSVNSKAILAWGGHIGKGTDWNGDSASSINGAPYHMRVESWTCNNIPADQCTLGNLGNQDRSLSADAVFPTGTIQIIKNLVATTPPSGDNTFGFTGTGLGIPPSFNLTTVNGTDSVTFTEVLTGAKTVTESTIPTGWNFVSLFCQDPDNGTTTNNQTAQIDLDANETVTCTFTNEEDFEVTRGKLKVIKTVINDNGGTKVSSDFTLHVKDGGVDITGSPAAGSATGTTYENLIPGTTLVVSEDAPPAGYTQVSFSGDCDNSGSVTIAAGVTKTCTITNDDNAPKLTLNKVVINDNGGTAAESAWTLTATGNPATDPASFSGAGAAGNADVLSPAGLDAGTYDLSETGGPAGYTASDWVCTGGQVDGNTVTVALGDDITCTITNDDNAPSLTLVKQVVNGSDPGGTASESDFTLTATGPSGFSGPGPSVSNGPSFDAGTYTLSETGPTGYDASAWVCVGGSQLNNTITLGLGQSATCTITNTAQGMVEVLKLTNGQVHPEFDINFTLYRDGPDTNPDLTGTDTQLENLSTLNDQDGILAFTTKLSAGTTYTVCENPVPAGWTSMWSLNGQVVTPYNPNGNDNPAQDLGVRCVDFTVTPGQTLRYEIHNDFPGGDPRTIGYWKNWNRCTGGGQATNADKNGGPDAGFFLLEDLLPKQIGNFNVLTCQQAIKILGKQDQNGKNKASDAAYELAAQLLAAVLNLSAGAETCSDVQTAVVDAQALLVSINFTGSGDYLSSKVKGPAAIKRTQALALANTLDRYNNGVLCP